jgi:hypothetical protein
VAFETEVVEVLLRARDQMGAAVAKAAAELEGLKKVAESNSEAFDRLDRRVGQAVQDIQRHVDGLNRSNDNMRRSNESLGESFQRLDRDIDSSSKSIDRFGKNSKSMREELDRNRASAKQMAQELDRLDKLPAGSTLKNRMGSLREEFLRVTSEIETTSKALEDNSRQIDLNRRSSEQLHATEQRAVQDLRARAAQYENLQRRLAQVNSETQRMQRTPGVDSRAMALQEAQQQRLQRQIHQTAREFAALRAELGRRTTINVNADTGGALADFAHLELVKMTAGKDITINVDADTGAAIAHMEALRLEERRAGSETNSLGGYFSELIGHVRQSQQSIARFDNTLRGLGVFLAVGLMQQLITVVIALGGALVELASSAAMAGAALGGALVAGIGQAIPVIDLLAAAFQRVHTVMQAVTEQMLVRQQRDAQQQKGNASQISSTNSLANAHDSLKNSQQGVLTAQQGLLASQVNLTRARFQAQRQLQDLILSEQQAALAARGATLSEAAAQRQLVEAVAGGDVSGVVQGQLNVAEQQLNLHQARMQHARTAQDLSLQMSGSQLRPDTSVHDAELQVQQARVSLQQANAAVEQAKRGIQDAAASEAQTSAQYLASGAKLNYMLGQLDAAEKRLFQSMMRLRNTFMNDFRPITDILINSFTHIVDRINTLFHDPKLMGGFTELAHSLGGAFRQIIDQFTSPQWRDFFVTMLHDAARNIGPLTDAFLNIANAFRHIAEAASPVLHDIIGWIKQGSEDFKQWVGHGKSLNNFFGQAETQLKGWLNLFGSVLRLFGALISSAAGPGLSMIKELTRTLNSATGWIEDHPKKMAQFWKGIGTVMSDLGKIVMALGGAVISAFDPKSVKAITDVIVRVLIPALGEAIHLFGIAVQGLDAVASTDAGATILKFAAALVIWKAIAAPIFGIFSRMGTFLFGIGQGINNTIKGFAIFDAEGTQIASGLEVLAGSLGSVELAAFAIPAAIAAAVVAFVALSSKFGVLDDEVKAVKQAFQSIVTPIKQAVHGLMQTLADLFKQIGLGDGSVKGLEKIFKDVFVVFVKSVLVPAIHFLGHALGGTLAMPIHAITAGVDILKGLFKIVRDILVNLYHFFDDLIHLRIGKAFGDLVHLIISPFKDLINMIGDVGGQVIDAFSPIADGIVGVFQDIEKPLVDAINWIIDNVINRIPGVQIDDISVTPQPQVLHGTKRTRTHNAAPSAGRHGGAGNFAEGGRVGFAKGGFGTGQGVGAGLHGKVATKFPGYGLPDWLGGLGDWVTDRFKEFIDNVSSGISAGTPIDPTSLFSGLFATGGRAIGPAGVDVIPANLTRDEFVVTPHGESVLEKITGQQGILNWLAGIQRPATGFFRGGRVGFQTGGRAGGAGGQPGGDQAQAPQFGSFGLTDLMSLIDHFGRQATNKWDGIWDDVQQRTKTAIHQVENQLTNLQRTTGQLLGKMQDTFKTDWQNIVQTVRTQTNNLSNIISGTMQSADQTTFKGMTYIGQAVQKALQAFGGKDKFTFNVPSPPALTHGAAGHAGGGFIGSPGERGGDSVPIWAGRGEAMLNWAQQRMVDPALRAVYGFGLSDMFKKVRAEHAGGGVPGGRTKVDTYRPQAYASGGFVFPFKNYAWGRTDQGVDFTGSGPIGPVGAGKVIATTSPGWPNGGAGPAGQGVVIQLDTVPKGYSPSSDKIYVFEGITPTARSGDRVSANQQVGTFYPGSSIELGWFGSSNALAGETTGYSEGQVTPAGTSMRQLLQDLEGGRAVRGGAAGGVIPPIVKKIEAQLSKMKVAGPVGALLSVLQGAIDMSTKAAEGFINRKAPSTAAGSAGYIPGTGAGPVLQQMDAVLSKAGLNKIAEAAIMGNSFGESSWDPNVGPGGLFGFLVGSKSPAALQAYAASHKVQPYAVATQVNFMLSSLSTAMRNAMNNMGLDEATIYFLNNWEGAPGQGVSNRLAGAHKAYAMGYSGGGFIEPRIPGFATGGVIGGQPEQTGTPTPILAHVGEWILNMRQQSKVAAALGTSVSKLRDWLGFSGGPGSFQSGGAPGTFYPTQQQAQNAPAPSTDPMFMNINSLAAGFQSSLLPLYVQLVALMKALGGDKVKIISEAALFTTNWLDTAHNIFKEINKALKQSAGSLRDAAKGATDTADSGKQATEDTSKAAQDAGKKTKDAGKKAADSTSSLGDTIANAFSTLTESGGLLDQLDTAFQAIQTQMATQLTNYTVELNKAGKMAVGFQHGPMQILRKNLQQLQDSIRFLVGEKGVIQTALQQAEIALKIAKRQDDQAAQEAAMAQIINLQGRLATINSTIAESQQAMLEKMEEILNQRLTQITNEADKAMSGYRPSNQRYGLTIRQSIDEAMGHLNQIPQLTRRELEVQRHELSRLRDLLKVARRRGDTDLATQLESQIGDLHNSIVGLVASRLQAVQERIDRQAANRQAKIDIQNRVADVQERFGDVVGAGQTRRQTLLASQANIGTQIGQYQNLIDRAQAQGFGPTVIDPLKQKLEDLRQQLLENQASLYENTIAIRQAQMDMIQNRQQFLGGASGGLSQILQTVGSITGVVNTSGLIQLAQAAAAQLQNTGAGLRGQLGGFLGEHANMTGGLPAGVLATLNNLQGLHGQDFVTALAGVDMNAVLDSLGGPSSPLGQQFESLVQAIIDNESALQDNTSQLQQLQQQNQIQQFTSTAWQWFRNAIFTGMGGLLPQYAAGTPFFAAEGADVMSDGLLYAHAGEIVMPQNWASMLRGLSQAHSTAMMYSTGAVPDMNSIAIAGQQAATMQARMSGQMPATDRVSELREMRKLLEAAGDTNVTVNEAEPGTDATYLANRIAFARRTPTG